MREHVFTEIDLNQDGVISYPEFIKSTQSDEFNQNEAWEVSVYSLPLKSTGLKKNTIIDYCK